jgi:hypothetical protein
MTDKSIEPLSEADTLRHLALLGPLPILSSEDPTNFKEIFRLVAGAVKPRNMIEMICIWHYVCATWIIARYTRHGTVAIERYAHQAVLFREQRAKLRQQYKSDRENEQAQRLVQTPTDVAQMVHLENNIEAAEKDLDDIMHGAISEREHNKAFQQSVAFHEQLNRLIASQTAIRNDSLRQLELFRAGLGQLVSKVTDAVIEGECEEIEDNPPHRGSAPSILPTNGANPNAVESQD